MRLQAVRLLPQKGGGVLILVRGVGVGGLPWTGALESFLQVGAPATGSPGTTAAAVTGPGPGTTAVSGMTA